jgi:uroporphyrinogen decarboxylase
MNELERFLAVVRFEQPDYWPLLAAHALGTPHPGALIKLHREGLPDWVVDTDTWCRYWGECTIDSLGSIGCDAPGIHSTTYADGDFEIITYETGARTRQVVNNTITYSMPDFQEFHVRDRSSWERYRALTTPRRKDTARIAQWQQQYRRRTRPLAIHCGGTWGRVREEMGPERALLALYDDPELVHDMIAHKLQLLEDYVFPVITALRPEIITMWEDFCYNHGMLISPAAFRQFCAPYYRRVAEIARNSGAELLFVDCDGKVDEFVGLLDEVGFNGLMPMEYVCGNDPAAYRQRLPRFIFLGGIEKEIASSGNARLIETSLVPAVTTMLEARGCFPMFDHGLSTNAGFHEHCRCMTRLHELCGSAALNLGCFPRLS